MRLVPLVRAILSSAVVVAGCAGGRAHLRRHTYPPNFILTRGTAGVWVSQA
jgi:hypothetical protein